MKKLLLLLLLTVLFTVVTSTCFAKVIKIGDSYVEIGKFITIKCVLSYTSNSPFNLQKSFFIFGTTGEATDNWFSGQTLVKIKLSEAYETKEICEEVLEKAFKEINNEQVNNNNTV